MSVPRARLQPSRVPAISRDRVDRLLDRAWDAPLTLIVGSAGSGKTTIASQLVERHPDSAVWYRAESSDAEAERLVDHLADALSSALGIDDGSTGTMSDLVALLDRVQAPLLIVIDEFDAISDSSAEAAIGDLIADLAPSVHLVLVSRKRPQLNLSRLAVMQELVEIGPDVLRFRVWEIDRLFRELYGQTLPPDELNELERRTGGWVAGLQLFHLATVGRPPGERRSILDAIGRPGGPGWEYVTENVLEGLPDELQGFLLETVPLRRMTGELCDELRGTNDSQRFLEELEHRQLFTTAIDQGTTYRYHEVLRSHLEGMLIEREGEEATRKRYRRAAEVLEGTGEVADAVAAMCRAEDWAAVSRLLADETPRRGSPR